MSTWAQNRRRPLEVDSCERLERLVEAFLSDSERGAAVRSLVFSEDALQAECGWSPPGWDDSENNVPELLRVLFPYLTHLIELDMSEAHELSALALYHDLFVLLPRLTSLEISDAHNPGRPNDKEPPDPTPAFLNLTSLYVYGYSRSLRSQDPANRASNLRSLTFEQPATTSYDLLMHCLPNPQHLRHLAFESGCDDLDITLTPILSSFTDLTELDVSDSHFRNLTPNLRLALQQSNISRLSLHGVDMDADELISLVFGPQRVPKLTTLHLGGNWGGEEFGERDMWESLRGDPAEGDNDDLEDWSLSWWLPRWGALAGQAQEVVDAARSAGVVVKGTIIEGLEMEKEFKVEEAKKIRLLAEKGVAAYRSPVKRSRL